MKKISLVILIFISCISNMKADSWLYSIEDAKKMALVTNKLILVDFWSTWCGPDSETPPNIVTTEEWKKEDVKLLLNNYILVRINISDKKDIASNYGAEYQPSIMLLDGNGKVISKHSNEDNSIQLVSLLKKYALSTEYLSLDLNNYYKNQNFVTSFRVAAKYQDYSLYLKEDLKKDFLNVADDYFKESLKHLKESDLENKLAFEQKIELFEIQENLILEKTKRALKMLRKIDESTLEATNQSFFSFLNYTANKQFNNEEIASVWVEKINENDKKKATLFL